LLNYDANGSLVTKQVDTGTTTYGWDELNRLKSVSVPYASPALAQSYTYDPLGRRIAKTANGVTTNTLFDGPDPLAGVHALYSSWTQPDSLIAQGEATDRPLARLPLSGGVFQATFDYHANGLGSVAAISQETSGGDVPQIVRVFEPWGMTMSTVGTAAAQAAAIADPNWQGRERDETGLSNFRARYYDAGGVNGSPLIGRFISRDPAGFAAGISLYAFGGNDPINNADPSGMTALSPAALTAGINGLMQDAQVSDFMNQMGLGGLSSSNQSLAYSAPAPNYSSGNTLATVQTTLAAASFVPGLGTVTGLIGATIDVASGDFVAAGLSLASAVPIVGEAGAAARTGMAVERTLAAAGRAEGAAANAVGSASGYSVAFETVIPKLGQGTRSAHFNSANTNLLAAAQNDAGLASNMEQLGVKVTDMTKSPANWTWHHVPDQPGTMQLVPFDQHKWGSPAQSLLHPNQRGGFYNWGSEY
jgi:RHS repeat-associated protein